MSAERFWKLVDKRSADECWPWRGSLYEGYGRFTYNGKSMNAHRASAFIHGLDVQPYLHVDHICHNRACVNPSHLRVVTAAENTMADNSLAPTALNKRKTHCKYGHEFTPENILPKNNKGIMGRMCRECQKVHQREYKLRRKKAILSQAREVRSS